MKPENAAKKNSLNEEKKPRRIRRADLVLLAGIALFAVLLFFFFLWKDHSITSPVLEISSGGKIIGQYPLSENREIRIGEDKNYNVCRIEDGKVRITEADCPDHSCIRSLPIDGRGGTIICLPHRLVIRITGGTGNIPDAVAE